MEDYVPDEIKAEEATNRTPGGPPTWNILDEVVGVKDPNAPDDKVEMHRRPDVADPTDKATNRTPGGPPTWNILDEVVGVMPDPRYTSAVERDLERDSNQKIDRTQTGRQLSDEIEQNKEDAYGGVDGRFDDDSGGTGDVGSGVSAPSGGTDPDGEDDSGMSGGGDGMDDDSGYGGVGGDDWNKGGLVTKRKRKRGKKRKK
jgi:hypothetical protein